MSFSLLVYSQEVYHILHVKGKVILKNSGENVKTGDKIKANAEIVFGSKSDLVIALGNKKGRFVIKPDPEASAESELSTFLKDVVSAASGKLSTRGATLNLLDLSNHFQGEYLVLGGRAKIVMNPKAFDMADGSFFFLRYAYDGETINKKLSHNGDTLLFDRDEIFQIDGKPIPKEKVGEMEFFYFEKEWEFPRKISQMIMHFPDDEEVKPGVGILVEELKSSGTEQDQIIDEVEAYLSDIYGRVHPGNLKSWLKLHYDL